MRSQLFSCSFHSATYIWFIFIYIIHILETFWALVLEGNLSKSSLHFGNFVALFSRPRSEERMFARDPARSNHFAVASQQTSRVWKCRRHQIQHGHCSSRKWMVFPPWFYTLTTFPCILWCLTISFTYFIPYFIKFFRLIWDLSLKTDINCAIFHGHLSYFHLLRWKVTFFSILSTQEASLYTVKAIAILDNDGERVVAKVFLEIYFLVHSFQISL